MELLTWMPSIFHHCYYSFFLLIQENIYHLKNLKLKIQCLFSYVSHVFLIPRRQGKEVVTRRVQLWEHFEPVLCPVLLWPAPYHQYCGLPGKTHLTICLSASTLSLSLGPDYLRFLTMWLFLWRISSLSIHINPLKLVLYFSSYLVGSEFEAAD